MANFESIVSKFIISAVMLISIFSFIMITQSDNNAPDPLINNNVFNESVGSLVIQIDSSTEDANEKFNTFNSEEPKAGFGSIVLFGIVSVGKSFSTIITGLFTSLVKLPTLVLGIPDTIYNLIFSWLIIATITGAWLLYKLGG